MTPACGRRPAGNPFSTRHVQPGALPYLFPAGDGPGAVAERLRQAGWWGQVVGPHGSGKSTLLAVLLPELRRRGREVVAVVLHDGQRRLPAGDVGRVAAANPGAQIVVDGYEQLGWWPRRGLRSLCRRCGHGLLVTAHAPVGLPHLLTTGVSRASARAVLAMLVPDPDGFLRGADLDALLARHRGNLREVLFHLYDVFEERRRGDP